MGAFNDKSATVYRPCGQIVLRMIGDDYLLVPVSGPASGGRVYPVNDTAAQLWRCFVEGATLPQAAQAMAAAFETSEEQALVDAEACLFDFLRERLLEAVGP